MNTVQTIQGTKNNYPFFVDALLSKYEQQMRDFLMYDFNISLKSMLLKYNFKEFDKYFFNSCRQTAIFGAAVLSMKFPEYTYEAFEATFNDTLFGKPVTYQHCFIIATSKEINRNILIDMARTTNPLVFEPISETHFYPEVDNYKDLEMISCVELPYEILILCTEHEYMTGLPSTQFLKELLEIIDNYQKSTSNEKDKLVQTIYDYPFKKMEQFKLENNILDGETDGDRFIGIELTTEKCNT